MYREGLLVGYRGYDHAGTRPRFPFGHGLGYTTWTYESAVADRTVLAPDGAARQASPSSASAGHRPICPFSCGSDHHDPERVRVAALPTGMDVPAIDHAYHDGYAASSIGPT